MSSHKGTPGVSLHEDIPDAQGRFMLLYNVLSSPKSAAWKSLQKLRLAVERKDIWHPSEDIQFVFLCGANLKAGEPSKRRQVLLDFSSRSLPRSKFFLAEPIFEVLQAEGYKDNILDVENELFQFADYVIIVLESESAFCELGAFAANEKLRKKLIVINDIAHCKSPSFINFGPIQAIIEASGKKHIIYYKMDREGKEVIDGIGTTFFELYNLMYKDPKLKRTRVKQCDPSISLTKETMRFIHDLIYFTAPISFIELSRVSKILFSKSSDRQLKNHVGLLCAIGQICATTKKGINYYSSTQHKCFFEYATDCGTSILAAFKNMYLRYDHNRFFS